MTKDELKLKLHKRYMTYADFAEKAGISEAAIKAWGRPNKPAVPGWVDYVFELLEELEALKEEEEM